MKTKIPTVEELMIQATRTKPQVPKKSKWQATLEMEPVIKELDSKGFSNAKIARWLGSRGVSTNAQYVSEVINGQPTSDHAITL